MLTRIATSQESIAPILLIVLILREDDNFPSISVNQANHFFPWM